MLLDKRKIQPIFENIFFETGDAIVTNLTREKIEESAAVIGSGKITLIGLDLRDLEDMAGIVLPGANFNETNLQNLDFNGAGLKGVTFESAKMNGVNFKDAHLENTRFYRTELQKANFKGAYLNEAYFGSAILRGTSFLKADLSNANFHHSDLRDANFEEATMTGVTLTGARYNDATKWPEGLVPLLTGALLDNR